MQYRRMMLAALALSAVPSAQLMAQTCFGYPTMDGQYALAGVVSFADGSNAYGAALNANVSGPLSLEAGYQYIDLEESDTNGNGFFGRGAWELSMTSLSVCPFAGVGYRDASEDLGDAEISVSLLSVPVGVGVGKRFTASPTMFVDLFAQPQLVWLRSDFEIEGEGGGEFGVDDSETEFGVSIGANLGTSRFYVGGGVNFTTVEDSDATFDLRVGIVLGGSR
jgi:hypothetical protein